MEIYPRYRTGDTEGLTACQGERRLCQGAGQVGEGRKGAPRGDGVLQDRHAGTGSEYSKYWIGIWGTGKAM